MLINIYWALQRYIYFSFPVKIDVKLGKKEDPQPKLLANSHFKAFIFKVKFDFL